MIELISLLRICVRTVPGYIAKSLPRVSCAVVEILVLAEFLVFAP